MKSLEERVESFIARAKEIHKDENYDYSKVSDTYINNRTNVCIIDHSLDDNGNEYGEFWVTPSNLLKGRKNPATKSKRCSEKQSLTKEEFIRRCKEKHNDPNLDYSKVEFKGLHEKVYIIDHTILPDGSEVGGYWQEANSHMRGHRNTKIAAIKTSERCRSNTEEFVKKAKIVHTNKGYDYSKVDYVNNRTKVCVICPKHGEFLVSPDNFLQGKGCPSCGCISSKAEDEIYNYIVEKIDSGLVKRRDKTVLDGLELDIYIPSMNFAIEYNGLRWHSEQFGKGKYYHLNKLEGCKKKGVTLFQIFEDEWLDRPNVVLSKIGHALGFDKDKPSVMARKCDIKEIDGYIAEGFLNIYHIQGFSSCTVYVGAYNGVELVGVMGFIKERKDWNLSRFATNYNYRCQGIGGKIFSYFIKKYNPSIVKTFLDRRWEGNAEDNLYTKLGFKVECIEKPDYSYSNGHGERLHKFGFRKHKLNKKYGLPLTMTESQMVEKIGYFKVWNCGLVKYIWEK